MKTILEHSFAKINLCLDIKNKREDGYHILDMVMVPVELHDSILIKELHGPDNFITIDDFSIDQQGNNIVTKAIELLANKYNFTTKFRVDIHKVTPMQAGLGGGSSDAAYTMKAVNKLLKLGISDSELATLASSIGADVPFFISTQPARCTGIGDIIQPINIKNDYHVLIVKPEFGCSTKQIYDLYDSMPPSHGNVDNVVKALEEGNDDLLAESIFNVLEAPAISICPEIQQIKNKLKDAGFKIVLMSGSGSSVFALSKDVKLIHRVAAQLEDKYTVVATKIMKG